MLMRGKVMQEALRHNTIQDRAERQSILPRPTLPDGDLPYPPHLPQDTPAIPNGTVVRADGSPDVYVIQSGTRRHVPDTQTLYLEGYTNASVQTVTQAKLQQVPAGQAVTPFPYAVASGEYRSSGGGHIAKCHASLNLTTGQITGTVTTTNYVMFTGYHSGTLVIPRNIAGDPVTRPCTRCSATAWTCAASETRRPARTSSGSASGRRGSISVGVCTGWTRRFSTASASP